MLNEYYVSVAVVIINIAACITLGPLPILVVMLCNDTTLEMGSSVDD